MNTYVLPSQEFPLSLSWAQWFRLVFGPRFPASPPGAFPVSSSVDWSFPRCVFALAWCHGELWLRDVMYVPMGPRLHVIRYIGMPGLRDAHTCIL